MRLYIGGSYQGKQEYVLSSWEKEHPESRGQAVVAAGEQAALQELKQADILDHFHLLVRQLLESGNKMPEIQEYMRKIVMENPDIWVICDEVGMGIVPIDAFERHYREVVGRCCCELAKEAEQVVRIICGIGMKIKIISPAQSIYDLPMPSESHPGSPPNLHAPYDNDTLR